MNIQPVNPIETDTDYVKDGNLHLDLFMYLPKDQDFHYDLASYSKFNAVYDPKFNWTVLFKKNQATKFGIDLSKFQKLPDTGTYRNQKILTAFIIVDTIIPIIRNSELKVYKLTHPIHTVQMIDIDEEDPENQDRVIIGRRFGEFYHLTISDKMQETMGKCGEKTFSPMIGAEGYKFLEGKIEDLGLYQALHKSGKNLMIGYLTCEGLKKMRVRGYHEKLTQAPYLLSREIEKSIDSKDKRLKQLSHLLSELLNPEVSKTLKENLIFKKLKLDFNQNELIEKV